MIPPAYCMLFPPLAGGRGEAAAMNADHVSRFPRKEDANDARGK
jgi:hypothetical protein